MPKFLVELRALRHLTVDRGYQVLYNPDRTLEVLRALSPNVDTLNLLFRGAGFYFNPCSPSERTISSAMGAWNPKSAAFPNDAYIDASIAFPSLTSLKLDDIAVLDATAIQRLPRGILDLSVAIPSTVFPAIEAAKALPPNLTSLEIVEAFFTSVSFWSSLPPSLTILNSLTSRHGFTEKDVASLPRDLKELRIPPQHEWTSAMFSALPSHIESASIAMMTQDAADLSLATLPRSMTTLNLSFCRTKLSAVHLRALPRALTTLAAIISLEGVSETDFPRSLTSLDIHGGDPQFFKKSAQLLPLFLRRFSLNKQHIVMDMDVISHLPQYLTVLSAKIGKFDESAPIVFPPGLETLDLEFKFEKGKLHYLMDDYRMHQYVDYDEDEEPEEFTLEEPYPAGLRLLPILFFQNLSKCTDLKGLSFEGAVCPISALEYYSAHLVIIKGHRFVHDAEFDLDDPKWIAKAQSLVKETTDSLCKEELLSIPSPTLPVHLFDLIPRKVRWLHASYPLLFTLAPEHWARLPKTIDELKLNCPECLDYRLLRHLPMDIMTKLELPIAPMNDEAIKLLGRRIERFSPLGKFWQSNEDTYKYCPPGLDLRDAGNDDLGDQIDDYDQERKKALCTPFSPTAFDLFKVPSIVSPDPRQTQYPTHQQSYQQSYQQYP